MLTSFIGAVKGRNTINTKIYNLSLMPYHNVADDWKGSVEHIIHINI